MIDFTPDPVFVRILGFPIYWYGIAYAVGLAATYWVVVREARFRGLEAERVGTGMIVIAIAALAGGRLYHVIDQWQLYVNNPLTAFLPLTVKPDGSYAFSGFTGLGVPGGIIAGTIAGWLYIRWTRQPFWRWADVVAPGLFVMQAVGRWGNFFNQELYGPPTSLPWGIRIDEAHRVAPYLDLARYPIATTHFHPLFLYESVSGVLGALFLIWLGRRRSSRLVPGDLLLIFFIWYGLTRFALEGLRSGNWTFFGVPTAQIVTAAFISIGVVGLLYRHGRGHPGVTAAELVPDPAATPTSEDAEDAFWDDEPDRPEDGFGEPDDDLDDDPDDETDDDSDDDLDDDSDDGLDDDSDHGLEDVDPAVDAPQPDRPAAPG